MSAGFYNPGFETGDFTYWSTSGTVSVQSATKDTGSYAARLVAYSNGYPVSSTFNLTQTVDLTTINEIRFRYYIKTLKGGNVFVWVSIDGSTILEYTASTSGWETAIIDTTSYSGEKEIDIYGICPIADW